jgi:two-component system, OmpR family, KDP operon response regulator KdpE
MTRILVVDDEPNLLRALRINLQARHYEIVTAVDGAGALRSADSDKPDLIVLDLGLPDMDGVDVIRELRVWSPVPIVVLSGRADSHDKVDALDAGADDYVTKPFSLEELLARVRAVGRRRGDQPTPATVDIGQYRVDLGSHSVYEIEQPDRTVHLTPTEWQLLELLLRNPGVLLGQRRLLQEVWGPTYRNETQYLRQYMTHLRKKLEPDPARPRYFLTEPGMGYRYQP